MPTKSITTLAKLAHKSNIKSSFRYKVERHCAFIQEWLERADTVPLSISLPAVGNRNLSSQDELGPYMDLFVGVADRVRSLEVTIGDADLLEPLRRLEPGGFPLLEELVLVYAPTSAHHENRLRGWERWGIFEATRLRSLTLRRFPSLNIQELFVDWSQLTYFNMESSGSLSVLEAYLLLSQCPELVSCTLDIEDGEEDTREGRPRYSFVSLPHLEFLSITERSSSLSALFDCLDVHSLRSVEFYSCLRPSNRHRSALITLLSRCPGGVSQLTIDFHSFTYADITDCLSRVPFLTHLFHKRSAHVRTSRLQECANKALPVSVVDSVLRLLTPSGPNDGMFYCPMLMHLGVVNAISVSEKAVLSFINSRRGSNAPSSVAKLQRVEALLTQKSLEVPLLSVNDYVDDGVHVELTYLKCPPSRNSSRSSTSSATTLMG